MVSHEFLLDDDSKHFKPAEWWATIMGTDFEFELKDMNKLSKAIGEFLKNVPKGTLGTSELISNDYADYGLTCLLLCADYGLQMILSAQVRCFLNGCRYSEKTSNNPMILNSGRPTVSHRWSVRHRRLRRPVSHRRPLKNNWVPRS